jgi:DnaJ family protein C protein 27
VNFWDLSGDPVLWPVAEAFLDDVQGLVMVYDVGNKESFDHLNAWLECTFQSYIP